MKLAMLMPKALGLVFLLLQCFVGGAQAHMMAAQRGTLNVVQSGAYMVLSLPASAFPAADDNADQLISQLELQAHRGEMLALLRERVQLADSSGDHRLDDVAVQIMPPDHAPDAPAKHVLVLGHFPVSAIGQGMRWRMGMFGSAEDEQQLQATVSRINFQTQLKEQQLVSFTPWKQEYQLFPSSWSVMGDYMVWGLQHLIKGPDHLLFLLVVLAAARGWRMVAAALTCFTAGHAITLTVSALGGVGISSVWIEPTIAATIIGLAALDLWAFRRGHPISPALRLCLVFLCALIHGLGLAAALDDLGFDRTHLVESLIGFNLGIEVGQIGIAVLVALCVFGLRSVTPRWNPGRIRQIAHVLAMLFGMMWFAQRLLAA